ncbi:MAG: DUF898 family protein [Alphaproteobacteria bacterium]
MTDITPSGPWGPRAAASLREAEAAVARMSVPRVVPGMGATPARFTGLAGELTGILLRGFVLQLVTLGIYRFWLTTEIRRFYWGHTSAGPETVAYTGTGMELFKGFLFALAIIVPIKLMAILIATYLPAADVITSVGVFVAFLFLGQYAAYAGRRYRLARTSWRGLRLRMTGSALAYALKAFGWSALVIMTLGLAYPWAAAALERIKMRETWFGDAQGSFSGDPLVLFRRGFALWLLGFGVPLAILISAALAMPVGTIGRLTAALFGNSTLLRLEDAGILWAGAGAIMLGLVLVLLAYPAFVAILARWRFEGMGLGGSRLSSSFTIGRAYRIYLLGYLGIFILGMIGSAIWSGVLIGAAAGFAAVGGPVLSGILAVLGYLGIIAGFWILKNILIDLRLWRAQAESLAVLNLAALDHVVANNVDASAMGDSLGDAVAIGSAF